MTSDAIEVYAVGIVYCSVCVPKGMSREVVEAQTNLISPTGISSPWAISSDPTFKNGMSNPCVCEEDPDRLHYLMEC